MPTAHFTHFDIARAQLFGPEKSPRFEVSAWGRPLLTAGLSDHTDLIVVTRSRQRRALVIRDLVLHNPAQGELAAEPYLITFCAHCHSAVGATPRIDGRIHHFSVGGLYNGCHLLVDSETRTYWNHISGEAVYGPLAGRVLRTWPVRLTTAAAALARDPILSVSRPSQRTLLSRAFGLLYRKPLRERGWLPVGLRRTMGTPDARLPEMTQGVGAIIGRRAVFYPLAYIGDGIEERWGERRLVIARERGDLAPRARWDKGGAPMQLFIRWYAFAYTYPDCEIGGAAAARSLANTAHFAMPKNPTGFAAK